MRSISPKNARQAALRRMQDLCQKFSDDRRGAIAILFGLVFLILVGVVGGAVDYGRWTSARFNTVNALDAAVLAGGRALQLPNTTETQALAIANEYFNRNKPGHLDPGNATFSIAANGTEITGSSTTSKVKTPFLGVVGIPTLPVNERATAQLAIGSSSGSHVEISLMLDTTGSMGYQSSEGGTKMSHLRAAAKDLIDIVVWQDQSEFTSRIALAPFAQYVKVLDEHKQDVTNTTMRCVKERSNANRYTDEAPNGANGYFDYKGNNTCGQPIRPLTSDQTALKDWIDQLPTSGYTAGHLGTAWSWYLLSPKWNSVWSSSNQALPYSMLTQLNPDGQPLLRKIAVLMTDGEYNREYSGDSSTTQARAICSNMKTAGIEIYAVGFEITVNGEADTTMQQCATSPNHYYNASSGDALRQAFRDIALKISTLRLKE